MGRLGTVKQKLMKLFDEVADATWPAVGTCWPSDSKPVAMTFGSRVSELWGSLSLPPAAAVEDAAATEAVAVAAATLDDAASLFPPPKPPKPPFPP